ncbi:MAG: 3-deoxy-D-manno-octulosonic acid transferase, partial [Ignavibacteriaceae bacterium]|nr:3-deoxy-D-manno-octulosonic acid transferase [Ignavibacteriaceae bacterium]
KSSFSINIIVSFFSPSGYENSLKYSFADIITYLPIDTKRNVKSFLDLLNPSIIFVVRYDIWPNFILEASKRNIPLFLVDATLRKNSLRRHPLFLSFNKLLFEMFTEIFCISPVDFENFQIFNLKNVDIKIAGDTRYDRVFLKATEAKDKKIFDPGIVANKTVIMAGSSWQDDEQYFFPAMSKLLKNYPGLIFFIVPHEPNIPTLERIENEIKSFSNSIRFSHLIQYNGEQVVIIDSIGILLALYSSADIAFVGGGFKSNVHNVLEAAVYGIPVIYGPKIYNSQEASNLAESGGGFIVHSSKSLYYLLASFLRNREFLIKSGEIAGNFVNSRVGATEKIIDSIPKGIIQKNLTKE